MPAEKKSFVNVDELMPGISLETAARFYGVAAAGPAAGGQRDAGPLLPRVRQGEGDWRPGLAIQSGDPAKKWMCHQYGCGKGGNLVSLCDLMKPGQNAGGRPRGERFKAIAADLKAMAEGGTACESAPPPAAAKAAPAEPPRVNVPLKESQNERARTLTELDRKFVLGIADMPPRASAYFRRRAFLTADVCREWRMGYLPRDTGEDKSGGTMRGKIVYPYLSDDGEVLTWFGRDPEFEEKHAAWEGTDKSEREPEKFHFVKGFHRGIELFGQHAFRGPEVAEKLRGIGLPIVEGPNDAIRLATLGVPAIGLCSNMITREQAAKVARLAREVGGGIATIFLDCDPEGENGMRQALGYLAELCPVRLAWTSRMYSGKFKGRQPESLLAREWEEIQRYLQTGEAAGWAVG